MTLKRFPICLLHFGRLLFAASLIAFGALHFVHADFVTRVVTHWPTSFPAKSISAYLLGAILVSAGGSVIAGVKPRLMLTILAGLLALSILLLHLPAVFADAFIGGKWTHAGKALTLLGGCLAVAASFRESDRNDLPGFAALDGRLPFAAGRISLALFMILAGAQHFRWFQFVVTLVPTWVPGGGPFWTYASAALLIAGGVGMLIPATGRLAAQFSGVMIFLWVFMLHIPRTISATGSRSNETTAVFEALAFSGLAFLYAATAESKRDPSQSQREPLSV